MTRALRGKPDATDHGARHLHGGPATSASLSPELRFYGEGGPATAASLSYPEGVAVDAAGNLYITEGGRLERVALPLVPQVMLREVLQLVVDHGHERRQRLGIALRPAVQQP